MNIPAFAYARATSAKRFMLASLFIVPSSYKIPIINKTNVKIAVKMFQR